MADDCKTFDIPCQVAHGASDVVGGAVDSVAGGAIGALADAVTEAVGHAVSSLATLWVAVGTPNLTSSGGVSPSDSVGFLQGALWWYMAAAAVFAVILGGARMAWEQRAEPGRELVKALLTLVVVSGAGVAAIGVATSAADQFSQWIIGQSLDGTDFGKNITALLGLSSISGLGAIIVIVVGLFSLLVSGVQIGLMVVRGGMLVLLAGVLPLSAAFTNTEMGRTWFKRCIAWLIAFILYKPAAAIVYATAFRLSGSDVFGKGGLVGAITGLVLMVLALLALPALMRFVVPMVSAVSAGGGAGAMAAGAVAVMPTGAMSVARGASAGSSKSGSGSSGGSSGAAGAGGASGAMGVAGAATNGRSASTPPAGAGGSNGAGGTPGATEAGGATAAASPGASGAAGATGAGGAGGAAGASGAAAAAGGAGMAAAAGLQAMSAATNGAQSATGSGVDEEGPDGSR